MTDNLKGALFVIVSCGFIAATSAIAKQLGPESGAGLHPLQVSFGRFLFGFMTLLPFVLVKRPSFVDTKWALHISRSVFGWAGVSGMFAAVALMPLAAATAISFLSPFFAMILAILFLGERAGPWRWGAAGIAFTGVVILTQPGTDSFQPAALIALMAAMFMGAELALIKRLTGTEPLLRILGAKPNQPIDLLPHIRFTASNYEIGGVDGPSVLAFGHPMGGDRALPAQEPTGCSPC